MQGHKKWITSMSYEPLHSNKLCDRFASSSKDGTVIIWSISKQLKIHTISGHSDSIEVVVWGGEQLLYTGSRDRTIRVWSMIDGEIGKLVRTLVGHGHRINCLSLNTEYLLKKGVYGPPRKVGMELTELYELSKKKYSELIQNKSELLVSGSDDYTMFLWSPTTSSTAITRLTGHQQLINSIAFSPDGRYFASASFDKKIKVWDGKTGKYQPILYIDFY